MEHVKAEIKRLGVWGGFIYVGIYIIATVLFIPGSVLTLSMYNALCIAPGIDVCEHVLLCLRCRWRFHLSVVLGDIFGMDWGYHWGYVSLFIRQDIAQRMGREEGTLCQYRAPF